MKLYEHFVKIDNALNIIDTASSAEKKYKQSPGDWHFYRHSKNRNYILQLWYENTGIRRWKFVDADVFEKTEAEIDAEKGSLSRKEKLLDEIIASFYKEWEWVELRHYSEEYGQAKGWTTDSPTLTNSDFRKWWRFLNKLRKMADEINLENYTLDMITPDLVKLGCQMPTPIKKNKNTEKKSKK